MFTSKRRKRIITDCSKGDKTDQSFKKSCDINIIMKNAVETNTFPQGRTIPGHFVDNTNIPSLEEAFEIAQTAMEHFATLPPEIRKLMDNDPAQLETFINDAENNEVLKKHGIIVEELKTESVKSEEPSTGGNNGTDTNVSE